MAHVRYCTVGGEEDQRQVPVAEGRGAGDSLDTAGFELASGLLPVPLLDRLRQAVRQTGASAELHRQCIQEVYPLVAAELQRRLGASRVIGFDHVFRCSSSPDLRPDDPSLPNSSVHNDYSVRSGRTRTAFHMQRHSTPGGLDRALGQRFGIVNVWSPLSPVCRDQLGMVRWASTAPEDALPVRLSLDRTEYTTRETYRCRYSPAHQWVSFGSMLPGESLLLKTYDSSDQPGLAKFAMHAALDDYDTPAEAPARESLEIRFFVFYGELDPGFGEGFWPPAGQAGQPGTARVLRREWLPPSKQEWQPAKLDDDELYGSSELTDTEQLQNVPGDVLLFLPGRA